MPTTTLCLELTELLYEAALGRIEWSDALGRVGAELGGRGLAVVSVDLPGGSRGFELISDAAPAGLAEIARHLALSDHSQTRYPHWDVQLAHDPAGPGPAGRAPGREPQRRLLGGRLALDDDRVAFAALELRRGDAQLAFECLPRLLPHLERALRLSQRIVRLDQHAATVHEAMERLPVGVFLLSRAATLQFVNRTGREILAAEDGLYLDDGALHARDAADDSRLRQLLAGALDGPGEEAGGGLLLGRPSGRRPYTVLVTPLGADDQLLFAAGSAVSAVYIGDPDACEPLSEDVLRGLYGLTQAEARLARLLAMGHTLEEAGDLLGTARGTLRVHLERIFRKTGTRRQPELIRLLLASPRLLGGPK